MGCAASSLDDVPCCVRVPYRQRQNTERNGDLFPSTPASHSHVLPDTPGNPAAYGSGATDISDASATPPPSPPPPPHDPSRVWIPSLVHRIASYLPVNEVTCTLRLVNKATACQFRSASYTTVRAEELVPHHYFLRCWADPGSALRDAANGEQTWSNCDVLQLTWLQRMTLFVRTAASGSIPNLKVLLVQKDRFPLHFAALTFAADAGQLDMCVWLRQQGLPLSYSVAYAAARRGDLALLRWVVESGGEWGMRTLCAAAAAGHIDVYKYMLEKARKQRGRKLKIAFDLFQAVAEGCDLPLLQDLWFNPPAAVDWVWSDLTAHAAASPTADWSQKAAWLEAQGQHQSARAAELVVERVLNAAAEAAEDEEHGGGDGGGEGAETAAPPAGDGCVARLAWLRRRGYPMTVAAVRAAARVGNLVALRYLLDPSGGVRLHEQPGTDLLDLACAAARGGHLVVLQMLQSHGAPVTKRRVLAMAVLGGWLPVVSWLVEQITATGWVSDAGGGDAGGGQAGGGDVGLDPVPDDLPGGDISGGAAAAAAAATAAGGSGGDGDGRTARRRPRMSPALAAAFAHSAVAVPELVQELAVLAVMSQCPSGLPRLKPVQHQHQKEQPQVQPVTDPRVVRLELLAWLYERGLAELHAGVFELAAQNGDLTLMAWLYEHDCPWDARAFAAAAYAGGQVQLEWLARQGCPLGDDGEPYVRAAAMTDLATLRCLRRLGCPWSEDGDTFTRAALDSNGGPWSNAQLRLASLLALQAVGCPVDWEVLRAAVRDKSGSKHRRRVLRELLARERRRQWREEGWWPWQQLRRRGGGGDDGGRQTGLEGCGEDSEAWEVAGCRVMGAAVMAGMTTAAMAVEIAAAAAVGGR